MFDDLEKGWAEEDKYSDFARDRIKRQLINLAVALIFVLGVVLWFLVRKKLRFQAQERMIETTSANGAQYASLGRRLGWAVKKDKGRKARHKSVRKKREVSP